MGFEQYLKNHLEEENNARKKDRNKSKQSLTTSSKNNDDDDETHPFGGGGSKFTPHDEMDERAKDLILHKNLDALKSDLERLRLSDPLIAGMPSKEDGSSYRRNLSTRGQSSQNNSAILRTNSQNEKDVGNST